MGRTRGLSNSDSAASCPAAVRIHRERCLTGKLLDLGTRAESMGEGMRKTHLQHTVKFGPTCQNGRVGGSLRGEHITVKFEEFIKAEVRCERCDCSKLFAFLKRQAHL